MGLFDKLFGKKPEPVVEQKPKKPRKPKEKKAEPELSAKDKATLAKEPYVNVLGMEVDPNDINAGAFELDWNDKFITQLVRAGYQMKPNEPDSDIVDRWFQNVCRNVVLETWEQEQAMNPQARYTRSRDLGGVRTEVS